jgi:murein DD-endopeptidase MepM/ murein hydrolase activator NlpD
MDALSIPHVPPADVLLDGRLGAIQRMDAEQGRAAAARELGVVFVTQLVEALRRTVPENSLLPRSPARDVYDGLFDRELASVLVANDALGLVASLGSDADRGGGPADAAVGRVVPPARSDSAAGELRAPIIGRVSSPYGPRRDPISGRRVIHRGIDFAAPAGTPVRAVAAGRVVASGWAGGAGHRVVLEHPGGYRTVYAHASRRYVGAGERVVANQVIAAVGSSGRATGPHLHFEVHRNGVALDPARAALTADAVRRAVRSYASLRGAAE